MVLLVRSSTPLIILGAVQQFQPVHGYFLRRELMTWHVDEWANIQPGSVYNALRTLEQDGYIVAEATESKGKRPARTTYSITPEGKVEFLRLFREALWDVKAFDTTPAMSIASFMHALTRTEVIEALGHRVEKLEAVILSNGYDIEDTKQSTTTPDYVVEIFDFANKRLRAEQEWVRTLRQRIIDGAYTFAGEASTSRHREVD